MTKEETENHVNLLIVKTIYDNTKYSTAACNRIARLVMAALLKDYKVEPKK